MRIAILSIAFLLLAFAAQSQVLKSAGVWYFLDVDSMAARPAVLPNGTELAYVVGTKKIYYWHRGTSTWTEYGSGSTFNRDSIYFDSSIIGSGTVSDPWGVDSTLFATIAGVGDSIAAALGYVAANFFPLQGGTLTGTGGNGFVGFPVQSSTPATPSTGFSLYAGSTGNNISWMQPDGFFRRLVSPVTGTPRQYQFMARSYTLGDSADIVNNVTSIAANYVATSNGTNLVARNLFDNNTYVGILNSKPWQFGQWTTAGRPTGTTGYTGYNTTTAFTEGYFTSQWENYITSTGASANQVPYYLSAGKIGYNAGFTYNSSTNQLGITSSGASNFLLANFQNTSAALSYIQIANATRNILRFEYPGITSWDLNVVPTLFSINSNGTTRMSVNSSGAAIIQTSLAVPAITVQSLTITKTDNGSSYFPLTLQSNGTAPTSIYHTGKQPGIIFDEIGSYYWRIGTSGNINSDFRFAYNDTYANSKFHITSGYKVAIGSTSTPVRDLDVTGELRIADLTTDPPTRIVGADADGDFGELSLSGSLSISGGTLTGTDTNFGNTNITATGTRTHDMQNYTTVLSNSAGLYLTSGGVTGGSSVLSDVVFSQYQYYNLAKSKWLAYYKSTDTRPGIVSQDPNFVDLYEIQFGGATAYEWGARVIYDTTNQSFTHTYGGKNYPSFVTFLGRRPASGAFGLNKARFTYEGVISAENETANSDFAIWREYDGGGTYMKIKDGGKFYISNDSTMIFDPSIDVPQFNKMGAGNKTAAALSLTESNYYGLSTNGTMIDMERKRDTMIYVTDADYNFSAAITSANILKRYNNIIIYSKLSASSTSDNQIFLHTPSSDFLQCTIIIYSNDASADSDATSIDFTTNGAVDGAGGTLSSYAMAPGQRVEIRVADDGGYKWFFN